MAKAQRKSQNVPDDLAVSQYMGSLSEIAAGFKEIGQPNRSKITH